MPTWRVYFDAAWLLARLIAGLLSMWTLTGVMTNCPGIARMIFRIQSNILVTCDRAMYSASVELRATDGCSTLPKTIRLPLRKIKYPVRERRDPFHCDQSKSSQITITHPSFVNLKSDL